MTSPWPRGRPKTNIVTSDTDAVKEKKNQSLEDAMLETKDNEIWQAIVLDPILIRV